MLSLIEMKREKKKKKNLTRKKNNRIISNRDRLKGMREKKILRDKARGKDKYGQEIKERGRE